MKTDKARCALRKSVSMFRRKVELALPISPTKKDRKQRREHVIKPGSLADDNARIAAGGILIDELGKHYERMKNTDARHFLITLCSDAGLMPDGTDQVPDVKAMCLKAGGVLRKLGLNGIGVLEIAPLRATKRNPACLVAHVQVVAWTHDPGFKPKAAANHLNAKGAFLNSLGAPGVTIQSRRMSAKNFRDKESETYKHLFSKLHRDQTEASMAWLGYYLFKAPAYVMQLCPNKHKPGKFIMRSNETNYSSPQALNLERLLNDIPILKAVFSVGKGTGVGRPWRASFRAKLKKLYSPTREKARRKKRSKAEVKKRRAKLEGRLQDTSCPVLGPRLHDVMDLIGP